VDIIDFYRLEQKRVHSWMRQSIRDLTPEEWNQTIEGVGNNIAFLVWHCVRTEDNILRFILQKRPTIWGEGNWHERLGLPPRVQGTGMPTEEARTIRIADPVLFMEYVEEVWREFEAYLAGITDGGADLSARVVTVKPLGVMPAIQAIGQVCISHLFLHLGEVALLLGSTGKKGLPL
jgi:DinB family protein